MNRPINDDGFKALMSKMADHARKTNADDVKRDLHQMQALKAESEALEAEIERLMMQETEDL